MRMRIVWRKLNSRGIYSQILMCKKSCSCIQNFFLGLYKACCCILAGLRLIREVIFCILLVQLALLIYYLWEYKDSIVTASYLRRP